MLIKAKGYYIYFLVDCENVVYVGQSSNFTGRISTHLRDKRFDSFYLLELDSKYINDAEFFYISKFAPKYNKDAPHSERLLTPEQLNNEKLLGGFMADSYSETPSYSFYLGDKLIERWEKISINNFTLFSDVTCNLPPKDYIEDMCRGLPNLIHDEL